jgi:hypothetical protein
MTIPTRAAVADLDAMTRERDELRAACRAAALWIGTLDISYWDDSPLAELQDALAARRAGEERNLPADTTAEQLRQVRDGVLIYRDGAWEMPRGEGQS